MHVYRLQITRLRWSKRRQC